VLGEAAHRLAGGIGVHGPGERLEAHHLGDQRAERGEALRAEHALAVDEGEAHQRAAQVGRRALELDQHALHQLARHFLEQLVLAWEVVVDGLFRNAGALRNVIYARPVAAREERRGCGAQHALTILRE
jgi:hypothetical protein